MKIASSLFALLVAALVGWTIEARSAEGDVPKNGPAAAGAAPSNETRPGEGPRIGDGPREGEGPREAEGPRRPPRGDLGDPNRQFDGGRPGETGFRPDGSVRSEGGARPDGKPRDDGDPRPQAGFRNDGGGPRGEFRGPPGGGSFAGGPGMGHGGQAGPGMMHGGFRGHGGPYHDMERLKDEDPEMYGLMKGDQDLERETFDLSNRYRQSMKSEDREKIKAELQAAVEKHFMVRQQRRELELKRLEEQLQRMKESVAKRLAEKGPIIEQRIKELTGEQDSGF